ncbi:MAG: amidohydrolase family protein, partial [Gammaproteobacteria bacterium]|nr:amidohydrolase family protein [Gammaproteobacteria bacterium]
MSPRTPVDYLLKGVVITMDDSNRIIREGCVAVDKGRILAVGNKPDIEEKYLPDKTLGGPDCFVTPGFIDCHNHLAQALVREFGMEDLPNIYRLYIPCEIAMDADAARISANVMIAQLLRAGVTTVAETTCTAAHEDMIADTIMQSGMRAVMARGQG